MDMTFLNIQQLERLGADTQTKVEELEQPNQTMSDRDKMKDNAFIDTHLNASLRNNLSRFFLENAQIQQIIQKMSHYNSLTYE